MLSALQPVKNHLRLSANIVRVLRYVRNVVAPVAAALKHRRDGIA